MQHCSSRKRDLKSNPMDPTTTVADSWGTIIKVCASANDLPVGIAPIIAAGRCRQDSCVRREGR